MARSGPPGTRLFPVRKLAFEPNGRVLVNERIDGTAVHLMQSMGRRDRKGRKIFAGDVVRDDEGHVAEVVYDGRGFAAVWWGKDGSWDLVSFPGKVQVVGNVHENPELIRELEGHRAIRRPTPTPEFRMFPRRRRSERRMGSVSLLEFLPDGGLIVNGVAPACHVMQSTGFADKQGRAVFEGDILKDDSGHLAKLTWMNREFVAFARDWPWNLFLVPEAIEVVGNIHENPRMLR
jgi:hypothetical protein